MRARTNAGVNFRNVNGTPSRLEGWLRERSAGADRCNLIDSRVRVQRRFEFRIFNVVQLEVEAQPHSPAEQTCFQYSAKCNPRAFFSSYLHLPS